MNEQKEKSKNIFQIIFPNTYDLEFRAESIKLGLIPDEEKIRQLKAEMYRFVRVGRPVDDHVKALNVLIRYEEIKERKPYLLGEHLSSLLSFTFSIGLMTVGIGILLHGGCIGNQTDFCKDVRGVSANVVRYFMYEEK
ncbi:hypothetical protein SD81_032675 [Tolypothrix campylonemoides VB511288]|nr:hypothetical protein SD81_032675 [Tolypothrix campylonemoides VB511288]